MMSYILALDQGTTSSRAILFDRKGKIVSSAAFPFSQIYPQPGWVEHDPMEIWDSQMKAAREAVLRAGISPGEIASIGITNQRETTILWDKTSGKPLYHAIVWQCRRSAPLCLRLEEEGWKEAIARKTGLVIDAYFSATKIRWLLDHVPGLRQKAARGEVLFGTVDSWLLYRLTGWMVHATDYSNASRTMLFNIHTLQWDEEILNHLEIPRALLPEVRNSSERYGTTDPSLFDGFSIPIGGIAGDQQAALFGQTAFHKGGAKSTYGTGCFLLLNTGLQPVVSTRGLLTTIAWGIKNQITYALEGSVFMGGAIVQWLRDELQIIREAEETEPLALSIPGNDGVYLIPAFTGLGAPYWRMEVRGSLTGLTRGAGRAHVARAALEAIAYQVADLISLMEEASGIHLKELHVDGGAVRNNFLMQFQADLLDLPVVRSKIIETTALGAAYLAGLSVGFWNDFSDLQHLWEGETEFVPAMRPEKREELYKGWKGAINQMLK
ncbi:MAG: glycerol kinase GlpK [Nitrospirae bacterium]|nr:glycerol kinase GlpK [Nitrospirota bacterium]